MESTLAQPVDEVKEQTPAANGEDFHNPPENETVKKESEDDRKEAKNPKEEDSNDRTREPGRKRVMKKWQSEGGLVASTAEGDSDATTPKYGLRKRKSFCPTKTTDDETDHGDEEAEKLKVSRKDTMREEDRPIRKRRSSNKKKTATEEVEKDADDVKDEKRNEVNEVKEVKAKKIAFLYTTLDDGDLTPASRLTSEAETPPFSEVALIRPEDSMPASTEAPPCNNEGGDNNKDDDDTLTEENAERME